MKTDNDAQELWICLACQSVWEKHQLYRSVWHVNVLTCNNLMCGGTCVPVRKQKDEA